MRFYSISYTKYNPKSDKQPRTDENKYKYLNPVAQTFSFDFLVRQKTGIVSNEYQH